MDAYGPMEFEPMLDKALGEVRALVISKHSQAIAEREATLRSECAWLKKELEQLRSRLPHADEKPLIFEVPGGPSSPSPGPPVTTPEETATQLTKIEIDVANVGHAASKETDYEVLLNTGEKPPTIHVDDSVHSIHQEHAVSAAASMSSCMSGPKGGRVTSSQKQLGAVVEQARLRSEAGRSMQKSKFEWTGVSFIENVLNPVMCFIILLNSVKLGVELDYGTKWAGWGITDNIFLCIYVAEILTKLLIMRPYMFFMGAARYWNIFDTTVVVLSGIDVLLALLDTSMEASNYLILIRLVRLGRFARILRIFQFKMFKELLTMLSGLVSGLRTLVWAFVLLFFPIYFLGILLTIFIGKEAPSGSLERESFGTLASSMFMVFRCTVGDCSYSNGTPAIMGLIDSQGEICAIIYIICVMVTEFGIFNLIMATFVDNALATAKKDEAKGIKARLANTVYGAEKSAALVERLWVLSGQTVESFSSEQAINMVISKEQFETIIYDEEVQRVLEDLDVPEDDRSGLFEVLDADGGGSLTLEELISGIMSLRGDPRRSDVIHVALVVRSLQDDFREFKQLATQRFTRIGDSLTSVTKRMDYVSPPVMPQKTPPPALMNVQIR